MQGYPEFEAVYERLRTSEVLEYEDKVQSARKAAEDEFREQFLAKLQENMKQAQNEFKELNKALKDITSAMIGMSSSICQPPPPQIL